MFINYLRNCFVENIRYMWISIIIAINKMYRNTSERKNSNDYIPLKNIDIDNYNDTDNYNDIDECKFHSNIGDKCNTCEQNITKLHQTHRLFDKSYCSIHCRNSSSDLLNSEQLLLVVEKPLTHVFPELYEENNNFLLNKKFIPNNNYKIITNNDNTSKNNNTFKEMFYKT